METVGNTQSRRRANRWELACVVAVVLLLRVPFLNQAVQGDDYYYLAGAQHAQIDPLHPNHARYVFLGDEVSMQGHPHPPLNPWILGALIAVTGDIREIPFHAAYILFSLVAALSMYALARRFSTVPLAAALLFAAVPAFVVNGNSFEADLPFLAFWMASIALFLRAVDNGSARSLAGFAAVAILAALAAYQAVVMVPILGVYLWQRRRTWRLAWAALAAGPLVLLLWQGFERVSTGAMPASVLAGYFQSYGLQQLGVKLKSALVLTGHAAWIVFPVLVLAGAWRRENRWGWLAAAAACGGAALLDRHPLFWASVGAGTLLASWLLCEWWRNRKSAAGFLAAWALLFFSAALALFFAGSARYLLPMAAPVAILVANSLQGGRRWLLAAGIALQMALGVALSVVNYQHWDGYRQSAQDLRGQTESRRVWVNGEWGLRHYFESDGALALRRGQPVQPGEMVVSSDLAFPIQYSTGGGTPAPVLEREITSAIPLRLSGLTARSGYSSVSLGLRPFDVNLGPMDRVRAVTVVERKPVHSFLAMNAEDADKHILSGVYQLEANRYRWMAQRAVLLLKTPDRPCRVEVELFLPTQSAARRVTLLLGDKIVAEETFAGPGAYTMTSAPVAPPRDSASLAIAVDKTFSVPGDQRQLGVILTAAGFKPVR